MFAARPDYATQRCPAGRPASLRCVRNINSTWQTRTGSAKWSTCAPLQEGLTDLIQHETDATGGRLGRLELEPANWTWRSHATGRPNRSAPRAGVKMPNRADKRKSHQRQVLLARTLLPARCDEPACRLQWHQWHQRRPKIKSGRRRRRRRLRKDKLTCLLAPPVSALASLGSKFRIT